MAKRRDERRPASGAETAAAPPPGGAPRHVIPARALAPRPRKIEVSFQPTPEERAAIAAALGLHSLASASLTGVLKPAGRRGWRFEGVMEAQAEQLCGVTLRPLAESPRALVRRYWAPAEEIKPADAAIDVAAPEAPAISADGAGAFDFEDDAEPEPEPLPDPLDLGPTLMEALSLALTPFPRAPEAETAEAAAAPPGAAPFDTEAERPFAALAALKGALKRSDDPAEGSD